MKHHCEVKHSGTNTSQNKQQSMQLFATSVLLREGSMAIDPYIDNAKTVCLLSTLLREGSMAIDPYMLAEMALDDESNQATNPSQDQVTELLVASGFVASSYKLSGPHINKYCDPFHPNHTQ